MSTLNINNADNFKVGSNQIDKIYKGGNMVWDRTGLVPNLQAYIRNKKTGKWINNGCKWDCKASYSDEATPIWVLRTFTETGNYTKTITTAWQASSDSTTTFTQGWWWWYHDSSVDDIWMDADSSNMSTFTFNRINDKNECTLYNSAVGKYLGTPITRNYTSDIEVGTDSSTNDYTTFEYFWPAEMLEMLANNEIDDATWMIRNNRFYRRRWETYGMQAGTVKNEWLHEALSTQVGNVIDPTYQYYDRPSINYGSDNGYWGMGMAETWNTYSFICAQQIEHVPAGTYTVSCQGYHRWNNVSTNTNANSSSAPSDSTDWTYLYAKDITGNGERVTTKLMNISDEASNISTLGLTVTGDGMPLTVNEAALCFQHGLYDGNSVDVEVADDDSTLEFGVWKPSNVGCDWAVYTNFKIKKHIFVPIPGINVDKSSVTKAVTTDTTGQTIDTIDVTGTGLSNNITISVSGSNKIRTSKNSITQTSGEADDSFDILYDYKYTGPDAGPVTATITLTSGSYTKTVSVSVSDNIDWSTRPLTIWPQGSGSVKWNKRGSSSIDSFLNGSVLCYRKNSADSSYFSSGNSYSVSVSSGDALRLFLTGGATHLSTSTSNGLYLSCSADYYVTGNPMSMLYGHPTSLDYDYSQFTTIPGDYCFYALFKSDTHLIGAKDLALAATTLTANCYREMFSECTNLIDGPREISATALAENCCRSMFNGAGIKETPVLTATTLATSCYHNMLRMNGNLNKITCLATTNLGNGYSTGWVFNISSYGTFIGVQGAQWPTGDDGIPSNWDYVYQNTPTSYTYQNETWYYSKEEAAWQQYGFNGATAASWTPGTLSPTSIMTPYGVYFWQWEYTPPTSIISENDGQTYYSTRDEAAQQWGYPDYTSIENDGYLIFTDELIGPDYTQYSYYRYEQDPNYSGGGGGEETPSHTIYEEDPENPGYNYDGWDMMRNEDPNNPGYNLYGYDMNHTEDPDNPGYNLYGNDMTQEDSDNPGYDYYGNPIT